MYYLCVLIYTNDTCYVLCSLSSFPLSVMFLWSTHIILCVYIFLYIWFTASTFIAFHIHLILHTQPQHASSSPFPKILQWIFLYNSASYPCTISWVYFYPEITESETCTNFHWILPECFPEYLHHFALLPLILAKLICNILSNFCQSGVKWYVILALIFIYQFTNEVKYLFIICELSGLPLLQIAYLYLLSVCLSVSNFIPADLQELFVYSHFNVIANLLVSHLSPKFFTEQKSLNFMQLQ